jgi:antagonist of KipI
LEACYGTPIAILPGPEWDWLTPESKTALASQSFLVAPESNRTGYRLRGPTLSRSIPGELVSSGVASGTVQLLPNGQLIVLMADHPVTGGYPRVAVVASASIPTLAQQGPGAEVRFRLVEHAEAEASYCQLRKWLEDLASI